MVLLQSNQMSNTRIHPHKFTLWVALGSIVMMFAGLTSAYIVKSNQANWSVFSLPFAFWFSTLVIAFSSYSIYAASKAIQVKEMKKYRFLILLTFFFGLLFISLQFLGFFQLYNKSIYLFGSNCNVAASFLGVITLLHILHVLGGLVALIVIYIRQFVSTRKTYSTLPVELVSTYWHFIGLLWIYLFVFFSITS